MPISRVYGHSDFSRYSQQSICLYLKLQERQYGVEEDIEEFAYTQSQVLGEVGFRLDVSVQYVFQMFQELFERLM